MKLHTCKCVWCSAEYQTAQPQRRRFCGNGNCYKQFHKTRQKEFFLTNKEFFKLIDDWMSQDTPLHPNKSHPVMLANKAVADLYRAATEAVEAIKASGEVESADQSIAQIIEQLKSATH